MVKGERGIAGRDSRFHGNVYIYSMEWRLEPVPLSRFAGNVHQVWTQLQLPRVLGEAAFRPFSLAALKDSMD